MADEPLPPEPSDARVFLQPVADSPRARRYMAVFDRSVQRVLQAFDVEAGLIRHTIPEGAPGVGPEIALLDRFERKRYISPLNQWGYRVGRTSASHIGTLAYACAQPLSHHHRNPDILRAVCNGFEAYIAHQESSGEFVFTPIRYSSVYGTHEMAWRLEPFITAFFSVRDDLTADQRTRYWAFLNRAMRFLQRTPCDHPCNRGMVWTAVMAMCWRATGDESYLRDAQHMWDRIAGHVFHESGQVNEGPGPDIGYSPISYEYLMRFRMMTGDLLLDAVIRRSTDWMAEYFSDTLVPFRGVSTRQDGPGGEHKAAAVLMGFELLVGEAPQYADMADAVLAGISDRFPDAAAHHGSITWITAAATHQPDVAARASGAPRPTWFKHYPLDATDYYTVGQPGYQTMIALRGIPARKGMQMWAVRGMPPFLAPGDRSASTVRTWGYDLASRDVTKEDRERSDNSAIPTVTAWHGDLIATYLFGPETMVVVHTFPWQGDRETTWVGNRRYIEGYTLHDDRVTARGTRGSLHWQGPAPLLREDGLEVRFRDRAASQAYAFAADEFCWEKQSRVEGDAMLVEWRDRSGHYVVLINHGSATVSAKVGLLDGGLKEVTLAPGEVHVEKRKPSDMGD